MRTRLVFALSSVLLTVAGSAAAGPSEAALAEGLFTSGKEAMTRGDLATACPRLAESLRLDPAVGTRLNLGTCLERSGKLVAALEMFTTARAQLPKDDFRVAFTTEHVESLAKRIGHVTVLASGATRVLLDGSPLAASELAVPKAVDPGEHVVVVEREGRSALSSKVNVGEGASLTVEPREVPAKDASADKAPPARDDASGPGPSRTLAWVTGGVGAAGIVAGAVTGLLVLDAANRYKADCVNGRCGSDGTDAAATGRTMEVVSPIAFGVGVLGLGACAYFLFGTPSKAKVTASLVPSVAPSGAGFSFARTF